MAFTVAELITAIRDLLNDTTSNFFTDAEITRWIQQAAVDISGAMKSYERWVLTPVTNGVNNYLAPESSDLIEVTHLQWEETGRGLAKIDPTMAGNIDTTVDDDEPLRWYAWQDRFWIEPRPNAVAHGKNLLVFYTLTTNDILNIPWFVQPLAITYGLYRAKLKDEKYAQAAQLYAIYMNELAFRRTDVFERPAHAARNLRIADEKVSR